MKPEPYQLISESVEQQGGTSRGDHLTFRGNRFAGRHGWLRLTPAYSVHLVERLVADLGTQDAVLDPFCGTGTTALVCAARAVPCDTIDVNPFLVWLASAKCARYDDAWIDEAGRFTERLAEESLTCGPAWRPPIRDIHKWWSEPTLDALSCLFARINEVESPKVRDLLLVAFCRVVIEMAAVSFGHQSMSFRHDRAQPTLFEDSPGELMVHRFRRSLSEVLCGARGELPGPVRVLRGDSRHLPGVLASSRYTAVITSPPYPNRMSYIRELRPYMYWLGYLRDGRQAGELDWEAIGGTWGCATSLLNAWQPDPNVCIPWEGFENCMAAIRRHSDVLSRYVHKYFEDVAMHVGGLIELLHPGGKVRYVVGNSKFYDVMVPTERIYAALFAAVGLRDVVIETVRKRTSKKELFEFIVHARKP